MYITIAGEMNNSRLSPTYNFTEVTSKILKLFVALYLSKFYLFTKYVFPFYAAKHSKTRNKKNNKIFVPSQV